MDKLVFEKSANLEGRYISGASTVRFKISPAELIQELRWKQPCRYCENDKPEIRYAAGPCTTCLFGCTYNYQEKSK